MAGEDSAAAPAGRAASTRGEATRGLEVRDVVVHYRDDDGTVATAVDGLSLDIAPGEVLALLGPSGSGKSTLLRAIAGLEPLSAGRIAWDGADLAGVPTHRRGFGLVFQDGQLFPHRDVAGNVAYGLALADPWRRDRDARRARVGQLLEVVGLSGFEHRDVASLSGGERQRVALARSLAPRPRLLLLDEPLSALDRALREHLAGEVRAALVATGTTALFVTHDHDEAFAVADRIAVMDAGRLLQVAAPADLWHRPASRRVAEFLGYEAFVALADAPEAVRVAAAEAAVQQTDDGAAPPDAPAARADGDRAPARASVLALGPGSLVLDDAGPLDGTVVSAGFRRGVVEILVAVDAIGEVTVIERSRGPAASTNALPTAGSTLRLSIDPAATATVPA